MRNKLLSLPSALLSLRSPAIWLALVFLSVSGSLFAEPLVFHEPGKRTVTLTDGDGQLVLRLNYNSGCIIDRVKVRNRDVVSDTGVSTGIRIGDEWFTSRLASDVRVDVGRNTVIVNGIKFSEAGHEIRETWRFKAMADRIVWRITRRYSATETATDIAFPEWNFSNMSTWTGGMLDNGGVIWNKYLDKANATYGGHFGAVTFWNANSNDCLRITPTIPTWYYGAGRFSRETNDIFSFFYEISRAPLQPGHGQNRFLNDRQDLWKPMQVQPSEITAEFALQALEYDKTYDRGQFVGLDGNNIRELLDTVARYGVIDSHLVGGNGWRSGYMCLHEPFFAQIAAALDSADYTANLSAFLDYARDHAIGADGRVKSRWCYGPWDAMPGSYDEFGFYEAQWGYLMDSQPDYVMNVVEQFYLTGDRKWLAGHKGSCERALQFLMRREVGNSGLVAMMTDSHAQQRGSDWIDIIWASYENAFVNAQFYAALNLWADAEDALGDSGKAGNFREFAVRLKNSFNKSTSEGGFWDSTNQWYVYWRDKDGSVHGNNLVTPVNFAAIAYGLCDNRSRQKTILDRVEAEMQKEGLFYWPLNFFPYDSKEGAGGNFPFPKYENGDIFLSWGELGVRAYAAYDPSLALKYVKSTLARYAQDGLSFQRYLRSSQKGDGDDILAGNCMPLVGLYRDIYGIQPKSNRLYIEPHLTGELDNTRLRYELRGQIYEVSLHTNTSSITAGHCTISAATPFSVNAVDRGLCYYPGTNANWAMSVSTAKEKNLAVQIENWPDLVNGSREWLECSGDEHSRADYVIEGLKPNAMYELVVEGKSKRLLRTDNTGRVKFWRELDADESRRIRLIPTEN